MSSHFPFRETVVVILKPVTKCTRHSARYTLDKRPVHPRAQSTQRASFCSKRTRET